MCRLVVRRYANFYRFVEEVEFPERDCLFEVLEDARPYVNSFRNDLIFVNKDGSRSFMKSELKHVFDKSQKDKK